VRAEEAELEKEDEQSSAADAGAEPTDAATDAYVSARKR
jgi:hypothetical protein